MAGAKRSQLRGTPVTDVRVDSAARTPSPTASRPSRAISVAERRARLGVRHHLAAKATGITPAALVDDLVALHATDPASVYLSAAARTEGIRPSDIADALYTDRTLIRMLGMRRTMFVVPTGSASAVVQHSCSDAVAARLRRTLVRGLATVTDQPKITSDPATWLTQLDDAVLQLLRESGEATALELSRAEPRLRTRLTYAEGKAYGGPAPGRQGRQVAIVPSDGDVVAGRAHREGDRHRARFHRQS